MENYLVRAKRERVEAFASTLLLLYGAEGGIRTPTESLPLPPQDSVSTSSTTSARGVQRVTASCEKCLRKSDTLGKMFLKINPKKV